MGKRKPAPSPPGTAALPPDAPTPQHAAGDVQAETSAQHASSVADKQQSGSSKRPNLSAGSWRGKATAVAEIARESITAAASSASETVHSKAGTSSPTNRRSSNILSPTRSRPSIASVSKVTATCGVPDADGSASTKEHNDESNELALSDNTEKAATATGSKPNDEAQERPLPAAKWRGWWTRGQDEKGASGPEAQGSRDTGPHADDVIQPQDTSATKSPNMTQNSTSESADKAGEAKEDELLRGASQMQRSSWFGLWGPSAESTGESGLPSMARKGDSLEPSQSNDEAAAEPIISPPKRESTETANLNARPSSGSWAFWSKDNGTGQSGAGELAVADATSVSKPQSTTLEAPKLSKDTATQKSNPNATEAKESTSEPDPKKTQRSGANKAALKASENQTPETSRPASLAEAGKDSQPTERTQDKKAGKAMPPNLLIPAFHKTYHLAQTPSYWQQLIRMFGRHNPEEQRHLSIATSVPRIKNALAIGVHGYFPSPIVQKVLGPPTGTSIRFAKSAATSIKKWADAHGQPCDIEMCALEGEGMVANRLDTLWKLLLNWIDQIRKADFILIACHSQGVPVACLLLEKLINFGVLSPTVRIGVCAMAGVNLGPFASYRSRFLDASASELFAFSLPGSTVSKLYASALETLLAHHVRMTYIGSIDDQLVSMESSTFSNISHPYIYRAVFVDGRIHAPDFLTHLVGFALKLRNLGIADHGLVRELSGPLAGSLYGGEGHSRIYQEPGVYDLAVEFALETTTLSSVSEGKGKGPIKLERVSYEPPAATPNPYILPWAVRGLLEEEFVRTELKGETAELLKQFESWKPSSKVLLDVKYRLEAVKSKL
ncbi:hypothetical protein FH972_024455 [Carpinus fangiana]|uniref:YMC020W-like alpha/beta hydrolase domain-containing protein n=1 Tax=Carpinus fangiana TaxID=176857 RepID=A0A5N6KY26_9ROSI|nr:hypothetical protein FH972_024455 [Carpinus fangiana]